MELSNNSFIVSTEQGNLVVNPKSIVEYKNITLIGDGYYDWGKTLAQDLAYIADEIASLKDGGAAQANFDATQFIAQFQSSQTTALNAHTENLLNLLDVKIQNKFTIIDQTIADYQDMIDLALEENTAALEENISNTTVQMKNEINAAFEAKTLEIDVTINTINQTIDLITKDILEWKADITPKLTSIIERFQQFKSITDTAIEEINKVIFDNYDDLNTRLIAVTNTADNIIPNVLEASTNYIDTRLQELLDNNTELNDLILSSMDTITPLVTNLETEVDLINTNLQDVVRIDNTILADAKSYTDAEIIKISGPSGSLTELQQDVVNNKTTQEILNNDYDTRIKEFESETGLVKTTASDLATFKQTTITNFTSTNKAINDLNIDINNRVSPLEDSIITFGTTVETLNNSVTTLQSNLGNIELKNDEQDVRLDSIEESLSTFTGDFSATTNDTLSSLDVRVNALEDEILPVGTIDSKITQGVTEAKDFAETKINEKYEQTLLDNEITAAEAKTYTDTELALLKAIIPSPSSIDEINASVVGLNIFKDTYLNVDYPTITETLSGLDQTDKNLLDLINNSNTLVDEKNNNLYSIIINKFNLIQNSMITYDTIFPLLNKILGYIIENKITKDELNNLFAELTNIYSNEALEQYFNGLFFNIFIIDGKLKLRLVYDKQKYFGIQNVLIMSSSGNKNYNNFISLSNGGVLLESSGKNFIIDPSSDSTIVNANLEITNPADIWETVIRTTYINEIGLSSFTNFDFNTALNISTKFFRLTDLYFENGILLGEFYLTFYDRLEVTLDKRIKSLDIDSIELDAVTIIPNVQTISSLEYTKNNELFSIFSAKLIIQINKNVTLDNTSFIDYNDLYINVLANYTITHNDDSITNYSTNLDQKIPTDIVYMIGVPT